MVKYFTEKTVLSSNFIEGHIKGHPQIKPFLQNCYNNFAIVLSSSADSSEQQQVLINFKEALALDPNNNDPNKMSFNTIQVLFSRGTYSFQQGKLKAALDDLEICAKWYKANPKPQLM